MDDETLRRAPKVLLHDHLDGGLRPQTIVELAEDAGYGGLPSSDPEELRAAMYQGGGASLEDYLAAFTHTVSVAQTAPALTRVAKEAVEDLAADGVVYAELRFAPELNQRAGLTVDEVLEAVLAGFAEASSSSDIVVRLLVTAMRDSGRSLEIAEHAVRWRDDGVVGFDIAGPEAGYPPTEHLPAFQYIKRENFHITIHAGEGYGLPSIWEAIQYCGAERLGHGVRLADDIEVDGDGEAVLGRLAGYVRDRRIALEVCPTSNVHTSAVESVEAHPIDLFHRLRFRVTVNTDNRLMSDVTMTDEFRSLADAFGYGLDDFETFTINAMKSAFVPFPDRVRLIEDVIVPRYAALRDATSV